MRQLPATLGKMRVYGRGQQSHCIRKRRYLRDLKRQVQDLKCAASTDNISRRVEPGAVAQLMLQGYLSILQDLNRKLPRHHKQLVMREASGQARLLYRRRLSRIPKTTKEVGFG